jgi:hypothetical protein
LIIAPAPLTVKARVSGPTISSTSDPLALGHYDILVDEIVGPDTLALTVSGAGAMIKDVI